MKKALLGFVLGVVIVTGIAVATFFNFKVDADGNYVYIETCGQMFQFEYGEPLVEHP
jgi:uncharacterized protein YxeA